MVDHFSDLPFVYLIESPSMQETIAAKRAFERMAKQYNVTIKHYHDDNLSFDDVSFKQECILLDQKFSYSGVEAPN